MNISPSALLTDPQKCDAVKPTCTNCQRHNNRQANASNPRVLECTWDELRRRRARVEDAGEDFAGPKRARMAELEAKIGEPKLRSLGLTAAANFERVLRERDALPPSGSSKRARSVRDVGDGYERRASVESDYASQMPSWRAHTKEVVWPNELPPLGAFSHDGASHHSSPDGMHLMWPK